MSDLESVNRITKAMGNMRFVARSKWDLPIRGSKPYWDKICEDIESKVVRVRNSATSPSAFLYPPLSPSILNSTSSASCDDINVYDFTEHHSAADIVDASEPIVTVDRPEPRIPDRSEVRAVKFQSNHAETESNDRLESPHGHWRLTKLSKMTKLVNDFLSSTRNRVRPSSAPSKIRPSPRRRFSVFNRKPRLTREQSFDDQSKDATRQHESPVGSMTPQESQVENAITVRREAINSERKVVVFRDDVVEMKERNIDRGDDIPSSRMGRPRAPSLSIASALPSFGKVVISIEDIDSSEEEESENIEETSHTPRDSSNFLAEDSRHAQSNVDKVSQDFLKVPEIRSTGHASYPLHCRSRLQQSGATSDAAMHANKSKLIMVSQALRKKHGYWPRKSLVNVFRALKAMKHGVQSKARIESETNRFFAAPLDIYSPSGRSTISSDDRTDSIDAHEESEDNGEMEDAEANELDEKGKESESSYASVRERLMRNAEAHVGMDFQPDRAMHEENAATSLPEDPSSFYNNLTMNELGANPGRNEATDASSFTAIPRVVSIFPRIKADKCLACMCQPLKDIDRPKRQRQAGRFFDNHPDPVVDIRTEPLEVRSSNRTFLEKNCRQFSRNTQVTRLSPTAEPDRESAPVIPSTSVPDSTIGTLTRTTSQLDDSHRSRTIGKSLSKSIITAKSLISSVSSVSERSKSNSDQDESDQGCADTPGNDAGLAAGSTTKYLAPCHMPVILTPGFEAFKALRHKKSRSINSRVASAEKSAGSANDDDDDSDDDAANRKLQLDSGKSKSEGQRVPSKLDAVEGPGEQSAITADMEKELLQTMINDKMGIISSNEITDYEEIISDRDVIQISIECLRENKNPTEILETLAREYSKRLSDNVSRSPRAQTIRKNEKVARNLLALLVDSKSYVNQDKWPNDHSDLSFSYKQTAKCNSRQLRRILPLKSYNLVAPILGMAESHPRRESSSRKLTKKRHRPTGNAEDSPRKEFSDSAYDLIVHPPSRMGHVSFENRRKEKRTQLNPYTAFLMKPRRKAITWRPLTERDLEGYDPEATLKMRATKMTDGICEEFCRWLDSLGAGNQKSGIDVNALKDMFETDFTADVSRTMQLSIKEMPMVPNAVAAARNCPGATKLALARRYLLKDAKAELKPKRTIGFGRSLPNHLKFIPPRNRVQERWLQCRNVPNDLETMDAVWKGITHLDSVKGFIAWLKAHPEVSPPEALENVSTSRETLLTRQSQMVVGNELNVDQIQNLKVGDNDPDAF